MAATLNSRPPNIAGLVIHDGNSAMPSGLAIKGAAVPRKAISTTFGSSETLPERRVITSAMVKISLATTST